MTAATISTEDLAAALAAFPDGMAVEWTAWIRAAEDRGTRFPSPLAAVVQALESVSQEA